MRSEGFLLLSGGLGTVSVHGVFDGVSIRRWNSACLQRVSSYVRRGGFAWQAWRIVEDVHAKRIVDVGGGSTWQVWGNMYFDIAQRAFCGECQGAASRSSRGRRREKRTQRAFQAQGIARGS